jgi:tetratricopeptide (TPR) repeat protein
MRNSFASKFLALSTILIGGLLSAPSALAADVERGFLCLNQVNLDCAARVADGLGEDPTSTLLKARVAFHQGDFERAAELSGRILDKAAAVDLDPIRSVLPPRLSIPLEELSSARIARYRSIGVPIPSPDDEAPAVTLQLGVDAAGDFELLRAWMEREHDLFLASAQAAEGLVVTRRGNVEVLHHPGIERILVQEAADAITQAEERIAPLLGGPVPGVVRVEIYPNRSEFIAATGLPKSSVNTTGVVAISKWNRLLLISPRALGDGYGWRDTLVHEWVHLVVSYHSKDMAPIWLQEGLAKSTEMLWRQDDFELEVSKQSLLAGALKTDRWVTFEQMHPSMAFLPSPELAGLAYAQVASMMAFLQEQTDPKVLARVIERVGKGQDAKDSVAAEANGGDFDRFEREWKAWLGTLDLIGEKVAIDAVGEHIEGGPDAIGAGEGAEDVGFDPVLSRRKELANRARLGDLMAEQGQHEAAMLYFEQAMPPGEPASPAVILAASKSLVVLGRTEQAMSLLVENLTYYPEEAGTQKMAAELWRAQGQDAKALNAYLASSEVNPFDVEVQQALVALYASAGQRERSARHAQILSVLTYSELEPS